MLSRSLLPLVLTCLLVSGGALRARQQPAGESAPVAAADLAAAINRLGDLDFTTRTSAARTVRRAGAAQAVPQLLRAVADHADGYVRFRALVLLAGFNDPSAIETMKKAASDPNDRLREVAYGFFEHNSDPAVVPMLLGALERELSEFVRPRLVRALAARGSLPIVRQRLLAEAKRGQDYFRGAVIEALGDYRAAYAVDVLTEIANLEGPLQDDAALALGKIGQPASLPTLAGLQRTAPRETQPAIAAAICLLGVNCDSHMRFLSETLRFADDNPGFQELLRAAAGGLAAVAIAGKADALDPLVEVGVPAQDPIRAPIALAVSTAAIRNPALMLDYLERHPARTGIVDLLRDGFDMLEEDFEEERFFAAVRREYWSGAEGSSTRQTVELLIRVLEF